MTDYTPMMRQYLEIKADHPDCILFFRLGDFYEMFMDDARVASDELELTLTTRDRGKDKDEQTPMCGVPYHSAEAYIARLISKGYKVAICEQTEDPALAKGLVRREVIRIITPGTVMSDTMLEDGKNNFICSVYKDSAGAGICFADISTGEVYATNIEGTDTDARILNEAGRFVPREAVLNDGAYSEAAITGFLSGRLSCRVENGGERLYIYEDAKRKVMGQFNSDSLEALGLENARAAVCALGGLLSFLYNTQKTDLAHLNSLNFYRFGQFMELEVSTRQNLELTRTLRSKDKRGSLLWVLDRTGTAMGGRLIRSWLEMPLLNPALINRRLHAVRELCGKPVGRAEIRRLLKQISDIERLIGRIVYGSANCRDLRSLAASAKVIPEIKGCMKDMSSVLLSELEAGMDDLSEIRMLVEQSIVDEPPFSVRDGGIIREGYNADVDRLRGIMTGARDKVAAIERGERERTGIKSLKIGYNKVFGYYIEITKTHYHLVPEDYIRKQTLSSCERFITQELKELESDILTAQDRITALEYELFCGVRQAICAQIHKVQATAQAISAADVLCSFAEAASESNYCMPEVTYSDVIDIKDGRHPVVERMLSDRLFVPNDAYLDCGSNSTAIITGPNMAGKSTYMRQVALITLMAQIGSFVPAKQARIGVVDRIFTRVGASDDLAAGQSTFMVEMTEVAQILQNATRKSLLILDEIGRGTSTFDGMSIARAVLEYAADPKKLGATTLFATHYHELTELEDKLACVKNYNIAVKKRGDEITFLRKIVRGGADDSYGIEVAKLAGIPQRIIDRAKEILACLESGSEVSGSSGTRSIPQEYDGQLSMPDLGLAEAGDMLRKLNPETLTPLEAMNMLFELKKKVGE